MTTNTSTTTTPKTTAIPKPKTEILVLNTADKRNVPIITNASGREDRNFTFGMENIEVYRSCGLTYRGEHYIFGGLNNKTQISKIEGCQLMSIGQLTFSHEFGACANVADNQIYLCFHDGNSADYKKCRVASSPLGILASITDSIEQHRGARIAASDCEFQFIY